MVRCTETSGLAGLKGSLQKLTEGRVTSFSQDTATVSNSGARARLQVPWDHDYEGKIEPAGTPITEAQLSPDWETPVDDEI